MWPSAQRCEPTEILNDASEDKFVLGTSRPAQPKPTKLQDALQVGDPRYATDFLPRMDGAGCPGGGGALGSLMAALAAPLQELRTPELAGLRWPTRRRFDPSSSPSASKSPILQR